MHNVKFLTTFCKRVYFAKTELTRPVGNFYLKMGNPSTLKQSLLNLKPYNLPDIYMNVIRRRR